jgi:hypothetical protein
MSGSIRLSPKHGVNPSILVCYACSEDSGGIVLLGRIRKPLPTPGRPVIHTTDTDYDAEAPRRMRDNGLCPRCTAAIDAGGVILIEMRDDRGGGTHELTEAEYEQMRTGRMWAIKGDAFDRIFNSARPPKGVMFIGTDAAAKVFGKPGEETPS